MKRLLVIAILMAFATGSMAAKEKEEPQCETCQTTVAQWFGGTAALAMAYQYASSQLPKLQCFNDWAISQGATLASGFSVWVMARLGRQAAAPKAD